MRTLIPSSYLCPSVGECSAVVWCLAIRVRMGLSVTTLLALASVFACLSPVKDSVEQAGHTNSAGHRKLSGSIPAPSQYTHTGTLCWHSPLCPQYTPPTITLPHIAPRPIIPLTTHFGLLTISLLHLFQPDNRAINRTSHSPLRYLAVQAALLRLDRPNGSVPQFRWHLSTNTR